MTDPGSARGKELQHSSIGSWGGRHTGSGSVSRPPGRCSLTEHCRSEALEQKRSGLRGNRMRGSEHRRSPQGGTWQLMGYQKGYFKQNPQLPASNLRERFSFCKLNYTLYNKMYIIVHFTCTLLFQELLPLSKYEGQLPRRNQLLLIFFLKVMHTLEISICIPKFNSTVTCTYL